MNKVHIWLDDQRLPGALPSYAAPQYAGVVWDWVKTYDEFVERVLQFGAEQIGFMALDHDLGCCDACEKRMAETDGNSTVLVITRPMSCTHHGDGTKVIQWLEETGHWPERPPTVHSFNAPAAERMRTAIARHYERAG